jgi:hypothetical protein
MTEAGDARESLKWIEAASWPNHASLGPIFSLSDKRRYLFAKNGLSSRAEESMLLLAVRRMSARGDLATGPKSGISYRLTKQSRTARFMSDQTASSKLLPRSKTKQDEFLPRIIKGYDAEELCLVTVRQGSQTPIGERVFNVAVRMYHRRGPRQAETPDYWEIQWARAKPVLRENFWRYMREHCPDVELVREAVANLKLPEEWNDLFEETQS